MTNVLSPSLSASDLSIVMFVEKQELQIVFAADQTQDNRLMSGVLSVRQTSKQMTPDFQGFDVSSPGRSYCEGAAESSVKLAS